VGKLVSIGKSGRIVIEIEPVFKQELYKVLGKEGKSLKSWFIENAQNFLAEKEQSSLTLTQENQEEIEHV
jgi:hypothetical protein